MYHKEWSPGLAATMNNQTLYWDATYAIVLAITEKHPRLTPEDVGLNELAELVLRLPQFGDDPALATERILLDIFNVWLEEAGEHMAEENQL